MLNILKIGTCVLSLASSAIVIYGQTGTHNGFEIVKDEDGIVVHERWVTFPGSDPPITAREVKSEFFIRSNIPSALSLLRDESKIDAWQKHVSEFRVFPHTDSIWHEYSYHDIPWPVSDQDHFLQYTVQDPLETDGVFITFRTVADEKTAPLRKNVSRMTLSGSWYFQRARDGKIKATYRILSMPGHLPRFITDPVIRSNLMSTVKSFIALLEAGYPQTSQE